MWYLELQDSDTFLANSGGVCVLAKSASAVLYYIHNFSYPSYFLVSRKQRLVALCQSEDIYLQIHIWPKL